MESLAMAWWMWVLVGLALLVGELLTPGGFYIVFFGAGGLIVGILKLLGLSLGLAGEGLAFVSISVALLAAFRKPLMEKFRPLSPEIPVDELTREVAVALDMIEPRAHGKVELRGSAWSAHNVGDTAVAKAARCSVVRVDGLTLEIRACE